MTAHAALGLLVEQLAVEVASRAEAILRERLEEVGSPAASPYLTVAEAAELLRSSRQRVYDLVSDGRLTRRKDGSRVLVARAEIEAYLAGGAVALASPTRPQSRTGSGVAR